MGTRTKTEDLEQIVERVFVIAELLLQEPEGTDATEATTKSGTANPHPPHKKQQG